MDIFDRIRERIAVSESVGTRGDEPVVVLSGPEFDEMLDHADAERWVNIRGGQVPEVFGRRIEMEEDPCER